MNSKNKWVHLCTSRLSRVSSQRQMPCADITHQKKRGCYFKDGRRLRFFNHYSRTNCELECLANYTKAMCDCNQFSHPSQWKIPFRKSNPFHWNWRFFAGDKETKVCTMFDIRFYIDAGDDFSKKCIINNCSCLTDCTSINYNLEMSRAPLRHANNEVATEKSSNFSRSLFLFPKVFRI